MSYLTDEAKEEISEKFILELEEYAQTRRNCVRDNQETPELAALLVEKYGYGLATAAKILELKQNLYVKIDELVEGIDQVAKATRKKRWDSRPAGLLFGKDAANKMEN
jgi:hypothetical protein